MLTFSIFLSFFFRTTLVSMCILYTRYTHFVNIIFSFLFPPHILFFFSFTMLFYSQMRMREEELTPSEKPKKSCKFVLTSQLSRFILGGRCNEDNGFSHPPTIHSIFYVKLWIVREVISDTRRIVRLRYPYSLRLLPTARLLGLNPNALGSALISVSYQLSSAPPSAPLG